MPDYEGLIRAVDAGLCLRPGTCRDMSEADVAAYIASACAIKPAPIYLGSPPPPTAVRCEVCERTWMKGDIFDTGSCSHAECPMKP